MKKSMHPPRVALFIPSLRGGGAERAMVVFGAELLKRGYSVDLVVTRLDGSLSSLVPNGIRILSLGQSRTVKALPGLVQYLRTYRPLALYSTIMNANVVAAIAGRLSCTGVPVIVRESNVPLTEPAKSFAKWLTVRSLPLAYRSARGIIAVSEGVASELVSIDRELQPLVKVIPTPVVSEELLREGDVRIAHPWLQGGGVPVVVSAARLMPHKGFVSLIRAFKIVRAARPARLLILGEGPERERISEEIRSSGLAEDVQLLGFVTNPFPYMSRAAAFVLASEYEGLPNVLVQALAFGTPVVATDCKSGPREILDGGKFGRLVPVGDERSLAEGILGALGSERSIEAALYAGSRYGVAHASTAYLAMAGLPSHVHGAGAEPLGRMALAAVR